MLRHIMVASFVAGALILVYVDNVRDDGPRATNSFEIEANDGLPDNHPSVPSVIPTPPPGSGSGTSAVTWTVPEGWVEEEPSSIMRKAQYVVGGSGTEAECAVFYFGPGQGGGPEANALRWADQFSHPDGRTGRDVAEMMPMSVGGLDVLTVEVVGTFNPGLPFAARPTESLENHMLLGAIVEGPDANWFFKCTGPEETLAANRDAFRSLIGSVEATSPSASPSARATDE